MPASASPTLVTSSRFHRAARDGLQGIVAEATSRECNARDAEGLTPTLWAAFFGHVDVLRVIVSRGGVPGKYDRLGNTALHLAAAGGHSKCVSFLLALGEDVWALNVDMRSPRDLAAACEQGERALRLLDHAMARQMILDPKKCQAKKEKAKHRAEKLAAEYRKYHAKTKRDFEEEYLSILERSNSIFNHSEQADSLRIARRHSLHSDLVSVAASSATAGSLWSTVRLQALQRGRRASSNSKASSHLTFAPSMSAGTQRRPRTFDFKVGAVGSDGSRTARQLPGLAPNTEVLYVNGTARRHSDFGFVSGSSHVTLDAEVTDAYELAQQTGHGETLVVLPPELDSSDDEESDDGKSTSRPSIFDRPGFGNMAFRHSLTGLEETPASLLRKAERNKQETKNWSFKKTFSDVVDSRDKDSVTDIAEETNGDFDEEEEEEELSPLHAFLVAWGLPQLSPKLSPLFKGDLEALMLVTEDDLRLAGIPMGPRKKLMRAIELRNETLESPAEEDLETRL